MIRASLLLAGGVLAATCWAGPDEPAAKRPVWFIPVVRFTDHFNLQLTLERLESALALAGDPDSPAPLLLFSGTVSEVLAEQNPHTHTIDRIKALVSRGRADVGYDGSQEPTPWSRPRPNFRKSSTPEDYWRARLEALDWFLSEHKDHVRGDPDPAQPGGLDKFTLAFGPPSYVTGVLTELGGDSELVHLLRRRKLSPILDGIPDSASPAGGRNIHGYRGAAAAFGNLLSPSGGLSSTQIYWSDSFVHLSPAEGGVSRVFAAHEGRGALQKLLSQVERKTLQVILVHLFDERSYLKPALFSSADANPVLFGYNNPKSPLLPDSMFLSAPERQQLREAERDALAYINAEFLPRNPRSVFVTPRRILQELSKPAVLEVDADQLHRLATDLLERWKISGFPPPSFVADGDRFYSLADMFQLLVEAMARGESKSLVKRYDVYGPSLTGEVASGGAASVAISEIRARCRALSTQWRADEWTPLPARTVPIRVPVGGIDANAAQFLKVMARAYLADSGAAEVPLENSSMISEAGYSTPMSARPAERRASWTLKPLRIPD